MFLNFLDIAETVFFFRFLLLQIKIKKFLTFFFSCSEKEQNNFKSRWFTVLQKNTGERFFKAWEIFKEFFFSF